MSDNKPGNGPDKDAPEIGAALRDLGQQFEAVFRAAVENDRVKQLQHDMTNGVRQIATQLESALKSVQADPRVQQAEERGREAINQVQQSKVIQDVQEAFVTGVSQINDQLQKLVERLQANEAPSSTPTQQVPIEKEPPTTGETTKLDP